MQPQQEWQVPQQVRSFHFQAHLPRVDWQEYWFGRAWRKESKSKKADYHHGIVIAAISIDINVIATISIVF
jgi:hypothetical protein